MENLTVRSKEDLSSLWNIVKDCFPQQTAWMQKNKFGDNVLMIKKQYMEQFCRIISGWLHEKIYREELKKALLDFRMLYQEEQETIFLAIVKQVQENQENIVLSIIDKFLTMFKISPQIELEGFMNFCLQEYREELEDVIEECLETYLSERDYFEFLELLRYFVQVEENHFGHLIVVAQPCGDYLYYNEELQNITKQCKEDFMHEYEDEEAMPDDCLITILVLMLPEQISIFGIENISNRKFLKTLQNVFEERVNFFQGTDIFVNKKM